MFSKQTIENILENRYLGVVDTWLFFSGFPNSNPENIWFELWFKGQRFEKKVEKGLEIVVQNELFEMDLEKVEEINLENGEFLTVLKGKIY